MGTRRYPSLVRGGGFGNIRMQTPSTIRRVGSRYPRPPRVPSSRTYPCIFATKLPSASTRPIITPVTRFPGGSDASCMPALISTTQHLYSRVDATWARFERLKRLRISSAEILTMDSQFEARLRGHLDRLFKNDRMSIADFQQWFISAWWAAEDGASDALYELGSRIEHLLYIWSSGEWNDTEFRRHLRAAANAYFGNDAVAASGEPGSTSDPKSDIPPVLEQRIRTDSAGVAHTLVTDGGVGVGVIRARSSPAQVHWRPLPPARAVS